MRLSRKIDRALNIIIAISIVTVLVVIASATHYVTFADANGTSETFVSDGARYVTFFPIK